MNIIEVLREHPSRVQRDRIVKYIGSNPARFNELVEIFMRGPYRVTQRAAWTLSHCAAHQPKLVEPHLGRLVNALKQPGQHNAVPRNVFRVLQHIDIPKKIQGYVADVAFKYFNDKKQPVAVRIFAMTTLANLCTAHPELTRELIPLIEQELPVGSAGFRSRGSKVLKQLSKIAKH